VRIPGACNVAALVDAVEIICPPVAAHGRRVAAVAVRLAAQYGLPAPDLESIRLGALLHDIGKIRVPPHILAKPGRLTEREWTELRTHPETGCDLAERLGFDEAVCDIVRSHHERVDGRGYPHRLAGSAIAWAVRLVSVADAFDALTSTRAYRAATTIEAARSQLARQAGTRYCPWIISGLLSMPRELLQPRLTDSGRTFPGDGCPAPAVSATRVWSIISGGVDL